MVKKRRHRAGASEAHYQLQLHLRGDGRWKLSLTQSFIALSTLSYTGRRTSPPGWKCPLAQFISALPVTNFRRIGLRYVNAVSASVWAWEGTLDDRSAASISGIPARPDVEEGSPSVPGHGAFLVGTTRMKLRRSRPHQRRQDRQKEVRFIPGQRLLHRGQA